MADQEKRLKNRVTRQVNATEKQVEAFTVRLERFLRLNIESILEKISEGDYKGEDITATLGSLISELDNLGLSSEIAKIRELYADELQFVSDEFEEQDQTQAFSESDAAIVEALINNGISKIANEIEGAGLDIQSTIMQTILTGEEINVADLVSERGTRLSANIKTELNTALMVFNRTVSLNKAEELGFELFLYVGPDDKVTRPFCKKLLDKNPPIYTKEEINAMNNGQTGDVRTTGGGYNCRHHWRPISEESARSMGYGN